MLLIQPALAGLMLGAALADLQHGVALGVFMVVVRFADWRTKPVCHAPEWQLRGSCGSIRSGSCMGMAVRRISTVRVGNIVLCGGSFKQAGEEAHEASLGSQQDMGLAPSQKQSEIGRVRVQIFAFANPDAYIG